MNTSNTITTKNNEETTNVYVNSVHEINYLQRLKKINSRDNLYLNNVNPNTVTNNNYNTTINNHTTKNHTLKNKKNESGSSNIK